MYLLASSSLFSLIAAKQLFIVSSTFLLFPEAKRLIDTPTIIQSNSIKLIVTLFYFLQKG